MKLGDLQRRLSHVLLPLSSASAPRLTFPVLHAVTSFALSEHDVERVRAAVLLTSAGGAGCAPDVVGFLSGAADAEDAPRRGGVAAAIRRRLAKGGGAAGSLWELFIRPVGVEAAAAAATSLSRRPGQTSLPSEASCLLTHVDLLERAARGGRTPDHDAALRLVAHATSGDPAAAAAAEALLEGAGPVPMPVAERGANRGDAREVARRSVVAARRAPPRVLADVVAAAAGRAGAVGGSTATDAVVAHVEETRSTLVTSFVCVTRELVEERNPRADDVLEAALHRTLDAQTPASPELSDAVAGALQLARREQEAKAVCVERSRKSEAHSVAVRKGQAVADRRTSTDREDATRRTKKARRGSSDPPPKVFVRAARGGPVKVTVHGQSATASPRDLTKLSETDPGGATRTQAPGSCRSPGSHGDAIGAAGCRAPGAPRLDGPSMPQVNCPRRVSGDEDDRRPPDRPTKVDARPRRSRGGRRPPGQTDPRLRPRRIH